MTDPQVGILMMCMFIFIIFLGFPIAFTLVALGGVLRLLRDGRQHLPAPRPARVRRDVERRADRGAAVPVHGLHGRAIEYPRSTVPQPAGVGEAHSRVARRRDARHLRAVRHRDRDRRCRRHADGPARISGDAQGGLRHQAFRGRRRRGRLPGHPDSAEHHAHPVRRDGERVGGAALRRRVPARLPAREPVHALRHRPVDAQPEARAQAAEGADRHPDAADGDAARRRRSSRWRS